MVASHGTRAERAQSSTGNLNQPTVLVVDDDDLMRSALKRLLMSNGIAAEVYASGTEFLAQAQLDRPGCLVLDVRMPGMSGLEVQASLKRRRVDLPVIFLTGSSDIPIAVVAMREGAADFVEKPFTNDDLLARVRQAIDRHSHLRRENTERGEILRRLASLTARERSVMELVVAGKTNKEIARDLGASYRTIEIHRHRVMEKMSAPTLADLVRMRLLEDGDPTPI
jgi:two-component system response regulator FixJ